MSPNQEAHQRAQDMNSSSLRITVSQKLMVGASIMTETEMMMVVRGKVMMIKGQGVAAEIEEIEI